MDEESEVIDLKDEVGSGFESTDEAAHDIEALELDIPAFRVPDESELEASESLRTSGSFASVGSAEVPSAGIIARRRTGAFKRLDAFHAESVDGESVDVSPVDYDRQAMVKTMQMQAVTPADFEKYLQSTMPETHELSFLLDQRFAPEVIVLPPRVLIKRWQEGAPRIGQDEFARRDRQPTIPSIPSIPSIPNIPEIPEVSVDTTRPDQVAASNSLREMEAARSGPFQTMQLEALEIEAIEIDEPQMRRPPPQPRPPQPQPFQRSAQPSQSVQQQYSPAPPVQAQQPVQVQPVQLQPGMVEKPAGGDADPEMRGLIQELLEDEKVVQSKERPKRLRPRDVWFQEAFGSEYLRTLPPDIERQTKRDTDFIAQSLNLKRGARILDVACGFGRHAVELSSRGYEMVGLDLSMPMLQKALAESQARGQSIKYLHGDMRELAFQDAFDGCYIWQTSFGYFDDRMNLKVLQGIHRSLKTGGRFLIDVVNRDYVLGQMPSRTWWEGSSCIFLEEAEFDYNASVLYAKRSFIYEDGSPPLEQQSFVRLYSLHELRQMLSLSGFAVLEVSGELHHRGYFLGASSGRLLVLAEKKKGKG